MKRSPSTAGSKPPAVFHRLAGLETEYGIRFVPAEGTAAASSKFQLYQAIVGAVRRRVLTVQAKHFKEGIFTANGGAFWFEAERPAAGGGLVEGATPECRGPRQLLLYQRAQDQLLAEVSSKADIEGTVRLIKNDRDSRDNVYGAQENYEVVLASGWRLASWRCGLALLSPLALLTWLACIAVVLLILVYFASAGVLFLLLQRFVPHRRSFALLLFGGDLLEGRATGAPLPAWLEGVILSLTRIITAPLAVTLLLLAHSTAFSTIRRQLLPFLISRPVFAGSGMVDGGGRFQLADKAPAMNCVLGYGGFLYDRPIFTLGHLFKALCVEAFFSPRDFADLFAARHRLQIGLGDSNMADVAEYLRIGTTMLVLDAIEAGALRDAPRVRRPIRALRAICADPELRRTVRISGGRSWTAIELQRFYLDACKRFLAAQPEVTPLAEDVVRRWEEVLDQLEHHPETLVGSVDWITKKYFLEQAGPDSSWEVRKKIDIRYHELSPDGYFQMLKDAGLAPMLLEPNEIERAIRSSPANSPATTRGHYIREFAPGADHLAVNWKSIVIGSGRRSRTIRLARYGQPRSRPDAPISA